MVEDFIERASKSISFQQSSDTISMLDRLELVVL